jgi:hypothetical protein
MKPVEKSMPIELTRTHAHCAISERFSLSNHQWEEMLLVAKDFGWKPQDAPHDDWERVYFASNGDLISERDALALADALARALLKLPEPSRTLSRNFLNFCKRGAFHIE